ncbi:MAG TPA: lactonase family protein [Phnomibacter sp.]|nr:lactonase family protein [Phnomibacter sp.]
MRVSFLLLLVIVSTSLAAQYQQKLLIGTYTQSGSHGIYVALFDTLTGQLILHDSVSASNPSFLCLSPNGRNVYAVSETAADKPGTVLAFDFSHETGTLKFLNGQSSGGDHPCHLSMDEMGRFVVVANYSGGSLSVLPVDKLGTLKPAVQVVQRSGKGPNVQRQEKPHVHQALFSPRQKHVVIADLGTDEVVAYPFEKAKPAPLDTGRRAIRVGMAGGSGPRHVAFHPTRSVFYVIEELSGNISVHTFKKRKITRRQTIACDTISKQPGSADIHVSPDGRFVYATNRAEANNICIYSVRKNNGLLERSGCVPVEGLTPRNFTIHPSGKWLLVANQNSHQVVVFERDVETGQIRPSGKELNLPSPVCLVFAH